MVDKMVAVAPPPNWIPEDDLLLKNAVEAGASLESLARGAVQFSRRFTLHELQNRWYSLLYDPVVSAEASAFMIEFENSVSNLQSRANRLENTKETKCSSVKRKGESIRKRYYAMRKRICNDPFDTVDIFSLPDPGSSNFGEGNEPPFGDFLVGNPISNHLGIIGSEFNIKHQSFPEVVTFGVESSGHDGGGIQDLIEDLPFSGNNVSANFSCANKEISMPRGSGHAKEFPVFDFIETEGLEIKSSAVFGKPNQDEGNVFAEFGGTSFLNFNSSSPLPQMSIGDISAPTLPVQLGENDQQFVFIGANDANNTDASGFCVTPANSKLKNSSPCNSMGSLTPNTEDIFAELSSTLFEFTKEEMLLVDAEGKDVIDKSYLDGYSSLLLDSPNECEAPTVVLSESSGASKGCLDVPIGKHAEKSAKKGLYQNSVSGTQRLPGSPVKPLGLEYRNGVICCTLNTEDPDIPSNDDVFLPFRFPSPSSSSGANWGVHDACTLIPSLKSFQKANGGQLVRKTDRKDYKAAPHVTGSSQQSEVCSNNRTGSYGLKFELSNSNVQHLAHRNPQISEGPSHISSVNNATKDLVPGVLIEGASKIEQGKNLDCKSAAPCPSNHFGTPDSLQSFQKSTIDKKDLDMNTRVSNNGALIAGSNSGKTIVPEPVEKSLPSDQEEHCSENDRDVPYFSDVEAMILDIDLSPDEYDLQSTYEVQQYQHNETKRTIIRLEQAANSHMHRTMAVQGALAVLHGRYSKHFIKKPEILLGRENDDVKVDINLGRERNGGKISRKQAIINMDMNGSFHLKNLGKFSISVNSKEVASTMSVPLTPGCLIEVRGLTFIFETSPAQIQRYLRHCGAGNL